MSRRKKYQNTPSSAELTVFDMVKNLIPSVFQWYGLPEGVAPPSEIMEKLLSRQGNVALFHTNIGYQILPAFMSRVDQWGEAAPAGMYPIVVGSSNQSIPITKDPSFVPIVLYDQPSRERIAPTLRWYESALGQLRSAIDTATVWLKTPIIFETSEESRENVDGLIQRIKLGLDAIVVYKDSIDFNGIRITPTNVTPQVLSALHDSYSKIQSMLFEEIGVPDVTQSKMAQQSINEVILPVLPTALKTLARLRMRREWALKVGAVLGTVITVEAVSLSLIEQSITSKSGISVHLDQDKDGIPDIEEML